METTILELKTAFLAQITAILSNKVNCKLNNGYLTITALTNEKSKLMDLKADLLELHEKNLNVKVTFSVNQVRIKDTFNKYHLIDKKVDISVFLSPDNFQIEKPIHWVDGAGIDRNEKVTNFQISQFTEYISCNDINVEFIEIIN